MYSAILRCMPASVSELERSSITKSGEMWANPRFFSSAVNSAKRLFRTQEASGERTAPLGKVKPALESKATPVPSSSAQIVTRAVIPAFWFPVVMLAGGKISSAPSAFFSMRRVSFSELSISNWQSVSCTMGASRNTDGPEWLHPRPALAPFAMNPAAALRSEWSLKRHLPDLPRFRRTPTTAGTPALPPPSGARRQCAAGRCCFPARTFEKDHAPRS